MLKNKFALTALLSLMAASAGAAGLPKGALPGYLNAKTGQFTVQAPGPVGDLNAEAAATYNGAFVLNFNITLKSNIPTGWQIQCSQTVIPIDLGGYYYTDTKAVAAVRNGNTATCSVVIYYAWLLSSPSTMVSTTYSVMTEGASSGILFRDMTGNLPQVALPANNGTVTRTVNVTL